MAAPRQQPAAVALAAPGRLRGEVRVPGDKSISHRTAILNALARGRADIRNYAPGDDCQSTLACLQRLGVKIEAGPDGLLAVHGVGLDGLREPGDVLDCGNSGTTMRLLAGLLASRPFFSVLTGDASLRSRPMARVIEPLRLMGATLWGREGDQHAPLAVKGQRLRGISYRSPVASAQVKSAVLLAGLGAEGATEVAEPAPSRDHTERMLAAMDVRVSASPGVVRLEAPTTPLKPLSVAVPGDFSSAAFWLAAACAHRDASVAVRGAGLNPGRTGLLAVFEQMSAAVRIERERLEGNEPAGDLVAESSRLRAFDVAGDIVPSLVDELPLLAVLGSLAEGTTRIRDAAELRHKESDRITAMASQLARMGATIEEQPDGWTIHGPSRLAPAEVESFGDHRVAMALAVAGLAAGGVTIRGAECVGVSYPGFWRVAAELGAQVTGSEAPSIGTSRRKHSP